MRQMRAAVLVAMALAIGVGAVVQAASPHYKKDGQPVCTIASDGSSSCTAGSVSGLGNDNILIVVTVTGEAGTVCHNPGNNNAVPGQNPASGSSTGGTLIDGSQIKNGTVVIPPISTGPVTFTAPSAAEAGCPNSSWTVTVDTTNATYEGFYSFQQPPGQQINKLSFAF